jgi:hypothetical protein
MVSNPHDKEHCGIRVKILCAVAIVLLSPLGSSAAYADSDGYYCIGRGYLAYQFGYAAPPVGPHRLFVLPLGPSAKIEPPTILDIPQFQVHGMLCGDRVIQLAAYDAIYTIELDATSRPVRYASTPWPNPGYQIPPQFVGQSPNLGSLNESVAALKSVRIVLGSVPGGGEFLLEMTANATSSERCPAIMTTTRVVRTSLNGGEVQEFQIFRGPGIRGCGE